MNKRFIVIICTYTERSLLPLDVMLTLAAFQQVSLDPPRATASWCQASTLSPLATVRTGVDKLLSASAASDKKFPASMLCPQHQEDMALKAKATLKSLH